jgi:hypothetical protein
VRLLLACCLITRWVFALGKLTPGLVTQLLFGILPVQLEAMLSVQAGRYAATGVTLITHFTLPCKLYLNRGYSTLISTFSDPLFGLVKGCLEVL